MGGIRSGYKRGLSRPLARTPAPLAGGSRRTADFAKKHGKPWLHLSERGSYESPGERLAAFIRENDIKVLNAAGSRGSKEPGVAAFVKQALEAAFYPKPKGPVTALTI